MWKRFSGQFLPLLIPFVSEKTKKKVVSKQSLQSSPNCPSAGRLQGPPSLNITEGKRSRIPRDSQNCGKLPLKIHNLSDPFFHSSQEPYEVKETELQQEESNSPKDHRVRWQILQRTWFGPSGCVQTCTPSCYY